MTDHQSVINDEIAAATAAAFPLDEEEEEDHLMAQEATTISKLEPYRHMTVVEFLDYFFDHLCAEARENARRIVGGAFDPCEEEGSRPPDAASENNKPQKEASQEKCQG